MKKLLPIILTLLFLISCKSNQEKKGPQEPGNRPTAEQLFSEFDSNEDGQLSEDEVAGPIANDFKHIDSDQNGYLTLKELEQGAKKVRTDPRDP